MVGNTDTPHVPPLQQEGNMRELIMIDIVYHCDEAELWFDDDSEVIAHLSAAVMLWSMLD